MPAATTPHVTFIHDAGLPDLAIATIRVAPDDDNSSKLLSVLLPYLAESRPLRKENLIGRLAIYQVLAYHLFGSEAPLTEEMIQKVSQSLSSPISTGLKGEPVFPNGFSGSLSHTVLRDTGEVIASAAVQKTESPSLIGIDIEATDRPISQSVLRRIAHPDEDTTFESPHLHFCAKEAGFKAISPSAPEVVLLRDIWVKDSKTVSYQDKTLIRYNFCEAKIVGVVCVRSE